MGNLQCGGGGDDQPPTTPMQASSTELLTTAVVPLSSSSSRKKSSMHHQKQDDVNTTNGMSPSSLPPPLINILQYYDTMIQREQQFLKVHLCEPKRKCILSTPDVIQAHVEQVEEFIRRSELLTMKVNISSNNKNNNSRATESNNRITTIATATTTAAFDESSTISDVDTTLTDLDDDDDDLDIDDEDEGISIGFHSVNSFARISSYFAPTVVSAATQKAGNNNHSHNKKHSHNNHHSKQHPRKHRSNSDHRRHNTETAAATTTTIRQQPRIVGGMEFVKSETKRKRIQTIIMEYYHQTWFQRGIMLSMQYGISNNNSDKNFGMLSLLSPSPVVAASSAGIISEQQIVTYSSILHLRMKMKCYNFYQLHLIRRKPQDAYTQMIQNSILTSSVSLQQSPNTTTPGCCSYTSQAFQHQLEVNRSHHMKQYGHGKQLRRSSKGHHNRHTENKSRYIIPDLREVSSEDDSSSTGSSLLCSGLDFGIGPPSHPIQLLLTDTVLIDLAITGALGLNPKKQRIRAAYVDRKVLLSPDEHIVLLNRRSGIPIAVCTLVTSTTSTFPVVRMYATKRRVPNQYSTTNTGKLGLTWTESIPLYTWAEFVTETLNPNDPVPNPQSYSIYYVSDTDDGTTLESTPKYRASHEAIATTATNNNAAATTTTASSSSMIKVIGRTSREFQSTGCATISMCSDEVAEVDLLNDHHHHYRSHSNNSNDNTINNDKIFWKLSISQGIDPALFICFTAFIDEVMERTMRWHCEYKK